MRDHATNTLRLLGIVTATLVVVQALACRQAKPRAQERDEIDINRQVDSVAQGMTRAQVIELMGAPDWVGLPTDAGDFRVKDPETSFILYWRNPGFPVVAIHFDIAGAVRWDRGWLQEDTYHHLFEPSAAHGCDLPDRSAYCR